MTDKEHRMMQALYRAELPLRRIRRAAEGTPEEAYIKAATQPALDIIDEDSAAVIKQYQEQRHGIHT